MVQVARPHFTLASLVEPYSIGFNIQALGECLSRSYKWYESMFPI